MNLTKHTFKTLLPETAGSNLSLVNRRNRRFFSRLQEVYMHKLLSTSQSEKNEKQEILTRHPLNIISIYLTTWSTIRS